MWTGDGASLLERLACEGYSKDLKDKRNDGTPIILLLGDTSRTREIPKL